MKNATTIALSLSLLCFFGCKKSEELVPDCLEAKIEEFKQLPWAASIVKINKPGETLYWLIDSFADAGESVLNEACEVVCITDIDCVCSEDVVFCDETHLNFPQEVIWEK